MWERWELPAPSARVPKMLTGFPAKNVTPWHGENSATVADPLSTFRNGVNISHISTTKWDFYSMLYTIICSYMFHGYIAWVLRGLSKNSPKDFHQVSSMLIHFPQNFSSFLPGFYLGLLRFLRWRHRGLLFTAPQRPVSEPRAINLWEIDYNYDAYIVTKNGWWCARATKNPKKSLVGAHEARARTQWKKGWNFREITHWIR